MSIECIGTRGWPPLLEIHILSLTDLRILLLQQGNALLLTSTVCQECKKHTHWLFHDYCMCVWNTSTVEPEQRQCLELDWCPEHPFYTYGKATGTLDNNAVHVKRNSTTSVDSPQLIHIIINGYPWNHQQISMELSRGIWTFVEGHLLSIRIVKSIHRMV